MKRIFALLLCLLVLMPAFAQAEKYEAAPEIFDTKYQTMERKEKDNRYFITKEYLITTNETVNAELKALADGFEEELYCEVLEGVAESKVVVVLLFLLS